MKKLILKNGQSFGDIVMLTAAVRDWHRSYPGKFVTDVRTSCPELWLENRYLTPLEEDECGVEVIDCHYPLIAESNRVPRHFLFGFIECLIECLDLQIEPTAFHGDIHLNDFRLEASVSLAGIQNRCQFRDGGTQHHSNICSSMVARK